MNNVNHNRYNTDGERYVLWEQHDSAEMSRSCSVLGARGKRDNGGRTIVVGGDERWEVN